MYWFTADQHYNHEAIIKHCNRPFNNVREMNDVLMWNHNSVVKPGDVVVHCGDFYFGNAKRDYVHDNFIQHLHGNHIFIRGNHDRWLKVACEKRYMYVKSLKLNESRVHVHCSHYPLRTWARGAVQLHGHCHGTLDEYSGQMDVGVDANNFFPVSLEQVVAHLVTQTVGKKKEEHSTQL